MDELWLYITEGGVTMGAMFAGWKYLIPGIRKLYNELVHLRAENADLREKLAYLKGKYKEKVIFRTHGKKPKDLFEDE